MKRLGTPLRRRAERFAWMYRRSIRVVLAKILGVLFPTFSDLFVCPRSCPNSLVATNPVVGPAGQLPSPDRRPQRDSVPVVRQVPFGRLSSIPFFAYDLALGDVVETTERFELARVLEPSGRYVFRVWLGDSSLSGDAVANELVEIGAVVEWSSANLLAIDASSEDLAQRIADYLHERERQGQLTYETGRS